MPRPARASKTKAINAIKKMFKKRKYVRKNVLVNRALQPFAQRYIANLKYSTTFTLNAGNSNNFYFNLNSIFDPDRTGIGHQPYGHDTLSAVYNRYRVIKCSYAITGYSGGSVIRLAAIPMNEMWPVVPGLSEVCENPRSKWIIQLPGGNTRMIKNSVYMPNLVGRNKAQYMADDRYQAQFGSSPSELAILAILGADISDVATSIQCTITLNYTVECFDVKNLSQS